MLERLIDRYVAEHQGTPAAEVASRVRILPVLLDAGGVYGLTAQGETIETGWDDGEVRTVTDERVLNIVAFEAANRHLELAHLMPQRPSAAVPCVSCGGVGVPDVPENVRTHVRCWCGGLGWVPSAAHQVPTLDGPAARPSSLIHVAILAVLTSVIIPLCAWLLLKTKHGFVGSIALIDTDGVHIREIALAFAWPAIGVLNIVLFSPVAGLVLFFVRRRPSHFKSKALATLAITWAVVVIALLIYQTRRLA